MTIQADWQIELMVERNEATIDPFIRHKENNDRKSISYGLSSFGYDLRLSAKEFLIFKPTPGKILDPKSVDTSHMVSASLVNTPNGFAFILPRHTYGLGLSVERLSIPRDCITVCMGKSSYARCGLLVNVTPFEPGWCGYPTLEITNTSDADAYIYANEGICQILFFKGATPETGYGNGKYQNQQERVVHAKV